MLPGSSSTPPGMQMMEVQVPPGMGPGMLMTVQGPGGGQFQVPIPDNVKEGMSFQFLLPMAAPPMAAVSSAEVVPTVEATATPMVEAPMATMQGAPIASAQPMGQPACGQPVGAAYAQPMGQPMAQAYYGQAPQPYGQPGVYTQPQTVVVGTMPQVPFNQVPFNRGNVPQGCIPGGQWVDQNFIGPVTICLVIFLILFFWPACAAPFCCPCDSRRVYRDPNGLFFLPNGRSIPSDQCCGHPCG